MINSRRAFLTGLGATLAAPAIIRTPGLLMPVRRVIISPTVLHVIQGADPVVADGTRIRPFATIQAAADWAGALARLDQRSEVWVGPGAYLQDEPIRLSDLSVVGGAVLFTRPYESTVDRLSVRAGGIVDTMGAGVRALNGTIHVAVGEGGVFR